MKTEKQNNDPEHTISNRFICKAPFLFSVTPNIYEEETEKERDKEWFAKIQQLEKKSQQLREKIRMYWYRQSVMSERMKEFRNMLNQQEKKPRTTNVRYTTDDNNIVL